MHQAKTMRSSIAQAQAQAPWRTGLRRAGLVLIVGTLLAAFAALHLFLNGQAATAGLDIYALQSEHDQLLRDIASQRAQLASITSAQSMTSRATSLGFKPVASDQIVYLPVAGYQQGNPVQLAPAPAPATADQVILSPSYTGSLWDWLQQSIHALSLNTGKPDAEQ